ncbi:MAG: hypothetical protein ACI4Q9_02955 [Candidatus Methanomethylophilaceae archaeon]
MVIIDLFFSHILAFCSISAGPWQVKKIDAGMTPPAEKGEDYGLQ